MNLKNSLYKVDAKLFQKNIELPTSKSHSNRALILGALIGNGYTVLEMSDSSDVTTLLDCLGKIGLRFSRTKRSVSFLNSFPACEFEKENKNQNENIDLESGDGGTTNRFLIALLALGKKNYRLHPSEKMNERPISDLLQPLASIKVEIKSEDQGAWLSIKGPAQIKRDQILEVDCSKSTQFASALMLAFSQSGLIINPIHCKSSETYLEMTKFIIEAASNKNEYTVPVDFSSLSYPLALALVHGEVLITNCHSLDPLQADSQFIELMIKAGGDIEWTKSGLKASNKNKLAPISVDGSRFPDLIPTLAFIASHASGESILGHLSVLRHKESDRISEICNLLKLFSIDFQFNPESDELRIQGRKSLSPEKEIHTARDHRMVMCAYLFLRANAGGLLAESDCVKKSFPHFFDLME
jgi:3-phosphoshikimate 1-carboxyvinyltransferase